MTSPLNNQQLKGSRKTIEGIFLQYSCYWVVASYEALPTVKTSKHPVAVLPTEAQVI